MAKSSLIVEMSSDEEKLLRGMQKVIDQQAKMQAGLTGAGKAGKKAGKETKSGMDLASRASRAVGSQVNSLISSYVGLHAVIGMVTAAQQEAIAKGKEAVDSNISIADSQAKIIKNIGDASTQETTAFIGKIKDLQNELNFESVKPLNLAAADLLSATGGDQQKTLAILRGSAGFFRDSPGELGTFAGSAADILKSTGEANIEKNLALLLGIFGQSRFTDLGGFGKVAPAIAAGDIVTSGDRVTNARETAALFAAIGSRIGDSEGALTKTATANLVANLREVTKDRSPELQTSFERLEAVRNSPDLIAKVLAKGFRSGGIKQAVEELLTKRESETSQTLANAFREIRANEAMVPIKRQQLTNLTPELRQKFGSGASSGAIENLRTTEGRDALANQILFDTLRETNKSGIVPDSAQRFIFRNMIGVRGAETPEDRSIKKLRLRESELLGRFFPTTQAPTQSELNALSPANRQAVDFIESQVKILRELEKQNESSEVKENTARTAAAVEILANRQPAFSNAQQAQQAIPAE